MHHAYVHHRHMYQDQRSYRYASLTYASGIRHPIRSKSSLIDFRLLHRPPRFIYILFYFFYYFMIFNFYLLYYIFIFYICIQQSTMGDNHPHLRRGQSVTIIRFFPFNQFKCIVSYVSLHCIGTVVVF